MGYAKTAENRAKLQISSIIWMRIYCYWKSIAGHRDHHAYGKHTVLFIDVHKTVEFVRQ